MNRIMKIIASDQAGKFFSIEIQYSLEPLLVTLLRKLASLILGIEIISSKIKKIVILY